MKRFICTYAQNDTPIHTAFWSALKRLPGELQVVQGFYKNPTSLFESFREAEVSWAPEVLRYLVDSKRELVEGRLTLHGNIRTQPTAANPLSSMEVYAGRSSAIFGHPKRALVTVATATRQARLLMTTGACTVANYSKSNAGAKGTAHHVIGALVIEVDTAGRFFPFQITFDERTQSFTHLGTRYYADRKETAPPALAVVCGDFHAGKEDPLAVSATHEMFRALEPQHVVWHDFFDNSTRNHHESRSKRHRYAKRFQTVKEEVDNATLLLNEQVEAAPNAKHHVVRSNHDEALDRWTEEHDDDKDPVNTPYWHELCAAMYAHYDHIGEWPDAFPFEVRRRGKLGTKVHDVHFLTRNEELRIGNIQCGFHGHSGINGARGHVSSYRKLGVKVIVGHGHAFYIGDGVFETGHLSIADHGYNSLPSAWTQGNVVIYADGKRSILPVIEGHWRGEGTVINAVRKSRRGSRVPRKTISRKNGRGESLSAPVRARKPRSRKRGA